MTAVSCLNNLNRLFPIRKQGRANHTYPKVHAPASNAGRGGDSARLSSCWNLAAGVSALAVLFSPAFAEVRPGQFFLRDTVDRAMFSSSSVQIGPTERQGAVAEVTFTNTNTNGPTDERRATITFDGVAVEVVFGFNVNTATDDRITIYPPDGYIAIPDTLTLPEESEGVSYIYPVEVPLG